MSTIFKKIRKFILSLVWRDYIWNQVDIYQFTTYINTQSLYNTYSIEEVEQEE